MATVYLPVQPIEGMDSAERAEALGWLPDIEP